MSTTLIISLCASGVGLIRFRQLSTAYDRGRGISAGLPGRRWVVSPRRRAPPASWRPFLVLLALPEVGAAPRLELGRGAGASRTPAKHRPSRESRGGRMSEVKIHERGSRRGQIGRKSTAASRARRREKPRLEWERRLSGAGAGTGGLFGVSAPARSPGPIAVGVAMDDTRAITASDVRTKRRPRPVSKL